MLNFWPFNGPTKGALKRRLVALTGSLEQIQAQATEEAQKESVRRVRATRDAAAADSALKRLEQGARDDENLMPHFIEASKAYVTLGEMVGVLKGVYGEYLEPAIF